MLVDVQLLPDNVAEGLDAPVTVTGPEPTATPTPPVTIATTSPAPVTRGGGPPPDLARTGGLPLAPLAFALLAGALATLARGPLLSTPTHARGGAG